jgi:hypothetical protein
LNREGNAWCLYRVDDNGNEILVETLASRDAAEAEKRRFEARGHKQAWLVRRARR